MKKFTATVGVIREINEKELSDLQKSYREYFGAKMEKFGVKSPAELDDAQKKEFFNEITKDWEKGKGATEAGKKDVEENGVKESEDVNESENVNEARTKDELLTTLGLLDDKLKKWNGVRQNSIHPFDPQKKVSDYVAYLKQSIGYVKAELAELKESEGVNEGVYSKTTKKFDLDIAKKKTGQILDIIRSGSGIGFCQINTEGDKAFLIIKADKDDQYDIEKILTESEDVNESVLAIAGGIILGALGLNVIAKIFKAVSAGVSLARITDPGKLKEITSQVTMDAITNKGINPIKAALWKGAADSMIDKGEIKNGFELAKSIKGISDIDLKKVFEEEGVDISSDVNEDLVTEKDIKSKDDFKAFAEDKLKKQHGDDFDQEKADKVIKGLSDEAEKSGDWGAAVGKLNKA